MAHPPVSRRVRLNWLAWERILFRRRLDQAQAEATPRSGSGPGADCGVAPMRIRNTNHSSWLNPGVVGSVPLLLLSYQTQRAVTFPCRYNLPLRNIAVEYII